MANSGKGIDDTNVDVVEKLLFRLRRICLSNYG